VTGCRTDEVTHTLVLPGGELSCRWVVNAAGLNSDDVDHMLGLDAFTVTPRRGQLLVFDKLARSLISHIVLPVPTPTTKGVLVSPTIYGNVLLGPTAEDLHDKSATATTAAGLEFLRTHGKRIMPALLEYEVTAAYAGLRAATEHSDYCYQVLPDFRYVRVGGIRSTGISSALALAEQVVADLDACGLKMRPTPTFQPWSIPPIAEMSPRPYQDAELIARDPDYGEIVCHCERATLGEIRDALASPIPPVDVDGLRRRTRTLMGRCQGFFCGARVDALLREGTSSG
jgi:glycerol-3-phosphate dehydrogenase